MGSFHDFCRPDGTAARSSMKHMLASPMCKTRGEISSSIINTNNQTGLARIDKNGNSCTDKHGMMDYFQAGDL